MNNDYQNLKKDEVKVHCSRCNVETNHGIVFSENNDYIDENFQIYNKYQIIKCRGCETISFRSSHLDTDDFYFDEFGEHVHETVFLYPNRGPSLLPKHEFNYLPHKIKNIYHEIIDTHNSKLFYSCASCIRLIIESVCKDKHIKGGIVIKENNGIFNPKNSNKLDGKINGLFENHLISEQFKLFLHQLRFLGNNTLHDIELPSKEELGIAIGFIEKLLFNIYEITNIIEDFDSHKTSRLKRLEKQKA